MNILELISAPSQLMSLPRTLGDPLENDYALSEAAVVGIRFDAIRSTLLVLFDMKGALHLRTGNTAVLAVENVTGWKWDASPWSRRTWWSVIGWTPKVERGWSVSIELFPDGEITVRGSGASLLIGDVPGGDEAPPDYSSATDEEIALRTAAWTSEMTPLEYQRLTTDHTPD